MNTIYKKLKSIKPEEQKKILLEMLVYIDKICRDNNIKYSLIGGSLIGAVRHKGFIPWDDDIDIILTKNNYIKLIDALKNDQNEIYDVLIPNETKSYPLQFAKIINNKTIVNDPNQIDKIEGYGLFIDIIMYNYVPNDETERKEYYNQVEYYKNSLVRTKLNYNNPSISKRIKRIVKNIYVTVFGYKKHLRKLFELFDQYSDTPTDYVMSINPVYGYIKETQESTLINEYIDSEFEGHKVMIFKNYDKILRHTFGDYMILPPKEKRVAHNLEAYWRK